MAEPTQADIDLFNSEVQRYIDGQKALGITISRDDAVVQFGNLLANQAKDPEGTHEATHPEDRIDALETKVTNLEARVATLEDVQGGTVVGPGA